MHADEKRDTGEKNPGHGRAAPGRDAGSVAHVGHGAAFRREAGILCRGVARPDSGGATGRGGQRQAAPGRPGRAQRCHAGLVPPDTAGGSQRGQHPDYRRERHRQGAGCACAA